MIRHFWFTGFLFVTGLTAYAGYIGHLSFDSKQSRTVAEVTVSGSAAERLYQLLEFGTVDVTATQNHADMEGVIAKNIACYAVPSGDPSAEIYYACTLRTDAQGGIQPGPMVSLHPFSPGFGSARRHAR